MKPASPLLTAAPEGADEQPHLQQALTSLDQMSDRLEESYSLLQARVQSLQGELDVVSAQRLDELSEKERLANRLQNLLDLLPGGVVVLDGQGVVREANPVAGELLGKPLVRQRWRDVIARVFAPRRDDGHEISLRDGRRVSIATRSLQGEPGQLILLTDLTETRRLQEQLARHERLSTVGRMVASLAHQIRTPLSSAMLYASHLADRELTHEQQRRFAGRLREGLHTLEHQVRDMLIFARGEMPLSDRLTPSSLLNQLRRAAEPHVAGLRLRWQCDVGAGEVLCNAEVLVGAVLNLLQNAIQAAGNEAAFKVHFYARGDRLCIAVSDSGPGMSAAVLQRLGEPFFTTRANGTGLGIAVVKAIARAHQGELTVRSRVGFGSSLRLSLPLLPAAASSLHAGVPA